MYTRYSKNGLVIKTLEKMDIKYLPFEEIEQEYQKDYKGKRDFFLEQYNDTLARTHKRDNLGSMEGFEPATDLETVDKERMKKESNYKVVGDFVEQYGIKHCWSWLGPQLLAHIGRKSVGANELAMKDDEHEMGDQLIDPRDYLEWVVGDDPRELGIYRMMTKVPRSLLMENQTHVDHLQVCALVPIYMAAAYKFDGIEYSHWKKNGLEHLVESELWAAMNSPRIEGITNQELLAIREAGLTYTSRGKRDFGSKKKHDPSTYHQLIGINDSIIGPLNRYARAMLTQIWCAHPLNRHLYMILDPWNWALDKLPEPLLSNRVIGHALGTIEKEGLPWEEETKVLANWEDETV